MIAKCSVTFEFAIRPPETWRGEVEASSPHTIVHRATKAAMDEIHPRNWSSMVCCIIERSGVTSEDEE